MHLYALARPIISRSHSIHMPCRLAPPLAVRLRVYGSDKMALSLGEAADFNTRNDRYFGSRDEYQRAVFLTVYWSEHDLDDDDLVVPIHKLGDEIKAWQDFFETTLGFELATCALPSSGFKAAIVERLETTLDSLERESNYILVVYYAGHNGINAKGSAELSAFVTVSPDIPLGSRS
jgi:hypothetical protein